MPRKSPDLTAPLFDAEPPADAPLAARMRPRGLDEFVGQVAARRRGWCVEPGGEARLPAVDGPVGSARDPARRPWRGCWRSASEGTWRQLSAVTSGVADVRALVADAKALRRQGGRTVPFIDELHRFNKAQQDALLPHVEDGTITPHRGDHREPVLRAQLRRSCRGCGSTAWSRWTPTTLRRHRRAGADRCERGLGGRVTLTDEGCATLLDLAGGDARQALNVLEAAAVDGGGRRRRSVPEAVAEAAQQRLLAYDRAGDQHYEAVSAFIKSMRGNDPDAALYWCARMVAAGEDPTFIARRIVIAASEDVGNADPRALQVAVVGHAGGRDDRAAGGPVRAGPGGRLRRLGAEVEPGRRRVLRPPWPTSRSRAACRSRSTCARRRIGAWPASRATARATSTRTTTPMPTSTSSTCPTSWSGHVYYEPSDQGMEQQIGERLARLRRQRREGGKG